MNISQLVDRFESYDLSDLEYCSDLVSSKIDGKPLPPYVPHIGASAKIYGIHVYAIAQNMKKPWMELETGKPRDVVLQMLSANSLSDVCIAPYRMMLALSGMYILAKHDSFHKDLSELHEFVSATNYYKFSLRSGNRDLNPSTGLAKMKDPSNYWRLNDELSALEIGVIQPKVIISFKGRHNRALRQLGFNPVVVNDPAWILRGGSGCLKSGGSWERDCTDKAVVLSQNYAEQLVEGYSKKRRAAEIYLRKYFNDWVNQ